MSVTTGRRGLLRMTAAVLAAIVLAAGAAACQPSAAPGPGTPVAGAPGPAELQPLLDSWRVRADVPAVALGVWGADGGAWVGTSGRPGRDRGPAVTAQDPFRVASITKLFVAVVVLQLVEEGRLGLDDPLSRHLPRFPAPGVTIRQLLNHTSGIPDYSQADGFGAELLSHRDRRWTPQEVLALVEDDEPQFRPGNGYEYSNTDYVLLGEVIAEVTGRTWDREVHSRILEPLGLRATQIAGAEPGPTPVVPGYFDADNDGDVEVVDGAVPWTALETSEGAAGAIVSTAPDLLVFADSLFRGRLVEPGTLEGMVTEGPFHPRRSNYGLGVEILRPDYRTEMWGHGGSLPGFRSGLWYVPSRDCVIVVLANDARAHPADLAELVMLTQPVRTGEP